MASVVTDPDGPLPAAPPPSAQWSVKRMKAAHRRYCIVWPDCSLREFVRGQSDSFHAWRARKGIK